MFLVRMWLISVVVVIVALLDVDCLNKDVLFTSGWYKTRKKDEKKFLNNVTSVGPHNFPNTASYLKIGGAIIPVLKKRSIHDLEILRELTISSAGVLDIESGAFENLPLLLKINLKDNGIRQIRKGIFNGMKITGLFLNKNEITTIDSDAFDDMPNLQKIKLNSNKIISWDSNWFKRTPSLSTVLIRRNAIQEIPENAFKNLIQQDLKIYLSKNKIAKIHPKAFAGIKTFRHLYLDRNKLTELNTGVFQGIQEIRILSIAKNNLTVIPPDLFSSVKSIRTLDLSANHRLHCVPVEVASVVSVLNLENINQINCTCIAALKNRLKLVGSNNLPCKTFL